MRVEQGIPREVPAEHDQGKGVQVASAGGVKGNKSRTTGLSDEEGSTSEDDDEDDICVGSGLPPV